MRIGEVPKENYKVEIVVWESNKIQKLNFALSTYALKVILDHRRQTSCKQIVKIPDFYWLCTKTMWLALFPFFLTSISQTTQGQLSDRRITPTSRAFSRGLLPLVCAALIIPRTPPNQPRKKRDGHSSTEYYSGTVADNDLFCHKFFIRPARPKGKRKQRENVKK